MRQGPQAMGLLDYYRQFDDMDESEVNRGLRERRAREKALALERVPVLDLTGTEWPEMPNAEVVGASVYQARGRLNGYPDVQATAIKRVLAELHYVRGEQIAFGNGTSELMTTAAYLLLGQGDELVTPWPSYWLYPAIAARAGARLVHAELGDGRPELVSLLRAVGPRSRIVVVCNPNDPTGGHLPSELIGELASRLPEHVHLFVDEAYVHFQEVEDLDATMRLVEAFPRIFVFRTFSKAYGLSGIRAGYVVGSPAAASFLASLAPMMGVNALTQAAVLQALRIGDRDIDRRRTAVIEQRKRLFALLAELPVEAIESQANFVWLRAPGLSGDELVTRLEQQRVRVAPGGPLGDERYVRAAIRDSAATERLVWALREGLADRQAARAGTL